MDIQSIATGMAQSRVQEEAAVRIQSMAIENMKASGEDMARVLDSAQAVTDPARGNFLDINA